MHQGQAGGRDSVLGAPSVSAAPLPRELRKRQLEEAVGGLQGGSPGSYPDPEVGQDGCGGGAPQRLLQRPAISGPYSRKEGPCKEFHRGGLKRP